MPPAKAGPSDIYSVGERADQRFQSPGSKRPNCQIYYMEALLWQDDGFCGTFTEFGTSYPRDIHSSIAPAVGRMKPSFIAYQRLSGKIAALLVCRNGRSFFQ